MADYAQMICEAVDRIVTKRIEDIKFDMTITCTVVDATDAAAGAYKVDNGSVTFTAYSRDTSYVVNDTVYVTIPNNDWNQQKLIVGKQVTATSTPSIYVTPFSTLLDATSNLIQKDVGVVGLTANAPEIYDEESGTYLYRNYYTLAELDYTTDSDNANKLLTGYTRLGVQGDFKTWLDSLDVVAGDYGYRLTIRAQKDIEISIKTACVNTYNSLDKEPYSAGALLTTSGIKWANTEAGSLEDYYASNAYGYIISDEAFAELPVEGDANTLTQAKYIKELQDYILDILASYKTNYTKVFSCKDMYGNPYRFESFYTQQMVIDISNFGTIEYIKLEFYETPGTFFNTVNDDIVYTDTFGSVLPSNLFTQNPYICVGYDLSQFKDEQAILSTQDSSTYKASSAIEDKDNEKLIKLQWLHKNENGNIVAVNDSSDLEFEVRWYRYNQTAGAADSFSGTGWVRQKNSIKVSNDIQHTVEVDVDPKIAMSILLNRDIITSTQNLYLANPNQQVSYNTATFNTYVNKLYPAASPDQLMETNSVKRTMIEWESDPTRPSWIDIGNSEFIYDPEHNTFSRFGFWEKFTTAFKLYQYYAKEFVELKVSDLWQTGGYALTNTPIPSNAWNPDYHLFPRRKADGTFDTSEEAKQNYPYYTYNTSNSDISTSMPTGYAVFTLFMKSGTSGTQEKALFDLCSRFANSFGAWKLVYNEDGLGDYVPADAATYAMLKQATTELYKAFQTRSYTTTEEAELENERAFTYLLKPDTNRQQEMVKAIIVYNAEPIYSNILTFTNEKNVSNNATIDALQGLIINCEDGSYGNYFFYNEVGALLDNSLHSEIRTVAAYFNSTEDSSSNGLLQNADRIEWRIPISHSMIEVYHPIYPFDYQSLLSNPLYSTNDKEITFIDTSYEINGQEFIGQWSRFMYDAINDQIVSIWIGDKTNGNAICPYLDYTIKVNYGADTVYNTIDCQIEKDKAPYMSSKPFSFGLSTTCGTDWKLAIERNDEALTSYYGCGYPVDNNHTLELTAMLYNHEGKEINLKDADAIANFSWHWFWYIRDYSKGINDNITIGSYGDAGTQVVRITNDPAQSQPDEFSTTDPHRAIIRYDKNLHMNNLLVIGVTLSGCGDNDLTAYIDIPIRHFPVYVAALGLTSDTYRMGQYYYMDENERYVLCMEKEMPTDRQWYFKHSYNHIYGTTELVYTSDGIPPGTKNAYKMFCRQSNNKAAVTGSGYWGQIISPEDKFGEASRAAFSPACDNAKDSEGMRAFIGQVSGTNVLQPIPIYMAGAAAYGVQYFENDEVYWTQPIVIMQNRYPIAMLNEWSGKGVEINQTKGSITSTMLAAGKKESDNSFTGILMGDWSTEGPGMGQIGLYGFSAGEQAFAFKQDGSAFIGRADRGRIYFNNSGSNSATIESSAWQLTKENKGLFLDIDNGTLKMRNNDTAGYQIVSLTKEEFEANKSSGDYYVRRPYQLETSRWTNDTPNNIYYTPTGFEEVEVTAENFEPQKYYIRTRETDEYTGTSKDTYTFAGSGTTYNPGTKEKPTVYCRPTIFGAYLLGFSDGNEYQLVRNKGLLYLEKAGDEQYVQITRSNYFEPYETYYIIPSGDDETEELTGERRYIDLDVMQATYPLSIGNTVSPGGRSFKVAWDGTCYINNGNFTGHINATSGTISGTLQVTGTLSGGTISGGTIDAFALYAYQGTIGGWTIDRKGLYSTESSTRLDATGGGISTEILKFIDKGKMSNKGQITDTLGVIGYVAGSDGSETTHNIGLYTTDPLRSIILNSARNIAFRVNDHPNGYIYYQGDHQVMIVGKRLSVYPEPSGGGCTVWIGHNHSTGAVQKVDQFKVAADAIAFTCDAKNQTGIYARFA